MLQSILTIRYKQFIRESIDLGFVRIVLVLLTIGFGILFLYHQPQNLEDTSYAFLFLIASLHWYRKDKRFLKIITEQPILIYFVEYSLLVLPLLAFLIGFQQWKLIPFVFGIISLISLTGFFTFSFQKKGLNNFILAAIPNLLFEWKAGVRKYFWLILLLFLLGIFISPTIYVVPTVLFVYSVLVATFFQEGESRQLIEIRELSAKKFMLQKLKSNLSFFALTTILFVVLFLIFHAQYWYIILMEYFISFCLLTFSITQKYAKYQPNDTLESNSVLFGIAVSGFFWPPNLPFIWIMSVYYYFQAIKKLNPILNDFD
jgi:hypothetical protein